MWFSATPFEICFSTTMFYSIYFISKCRCDDIPRGAIWKNNKDGSFQIYVHKIPPWKSSRLSDTEKNHLALKAWLLSTISVGVIACFCCICWKFYKRGFTRSHFSHVAVVPPRVVPPASRTVVAFQIDHNINTGVSNPHTGPGNIYSRGVVNFAFSSSLRDPVTAPPLEQLDGRPSVVTVELDDRPPEYSVVVSENVNDGLATALHPQNSQTKKVETPPPDYATINPFHNSNSSTNNTGELFI